MHQDTIDDMMTRGGTPLHADYFFGLEGDTLGRPLTCTLIKTFSMEEIDRMDPAAQDGLKRIIVGPSSESTQISAHRKYKVRIGPRWYEGSFSKRWFGWLFDNFGDTGMQLNLIDEVFEVTKGIPRKGPAKPFPPPGH